MSKLIVEIHLLKVYGERSVSERNLDVRTKKLKEKSSRLCATSFGLRTGERERD